MIIIFISVRLRFTDIDNYDNINFDKINMNYHDELMRLIFLVIDMIINICKPTVSDSDNFNETRHVNIQNKW